jgi:taurine-pyruvate aminotransferase
LNGLATLLQHKQVGDVRGKGLLIGVELVLDKTSKKPVDPAGIQFIVDFCKTSGIIVGRSGAGRRYSNTVTLSPPLVITRTECDRIVEVLDRAVVALEAKLR